MGDRQDFNSHPKTVQRNLHFSIGIWFLGRWHGKKVFVSALHCCQHSCWGRGNSGWSQDVSQLSGQIIGSPKHTRHLVGGGLHGGCGPHQMRHNPTYSWNDKTTSHLMLGLEKAQRCYTMWKDQSLGERFLLFMLCISYNKEKSSNL